MKTAVILSIILHLIFLGSLKGCGSLGGGNGDGDGSKIVSRKSEPIVVTNGDLGFQEPRKKKKPEPKCQKFYGGVGVEYSVWNTKDNGEITVSVVPVGYPAYDAGIRPGDVLMIEHDLRGEIGTQVSVEVRHQNGVAEIVTMTRAKICIEPPQTIKKPK